MVQIKEGDIYICTVKKVLQHGVIVTIDEVGSDGFIHISEISKRWVREVKDIVKEGDKLVCKVIRLGGISPELSVKRITDNEKKQALKEWSIENRITKILEKTSDKDGKKTIEEIKASYKSIFGFYNAIIKDGDKVFDKIKVKKEVMDSILDFVEKTKRKIVIKTELEIETYEPDGVERIKKFLEEGYSNKKYYTIKYIKSPHYLLMVNTGETKKTITENKKIIDSMEKKAKELGLEIKTREIRQ